MAGLIAHYFLAGDGPPTTPPALFGEWGFYQDRLTGLIYQWSPVRLVWSLFGLAGIDYPRRATCWHDQATFISGTKTLSYDISENYLIRVNGTPANGDAWTQSVFLAGGIYTLSVLGLTSTSHGKIDWYIDNVLQGAGGQDWYSGSLAFNVVKSLSVTVSGDGYHVLKGVINGKNASSSGYVHSLTKYWFAPSAD